MNSKLAQKEIFNALLDGKTVRGFSVDDKHMFVTSTGYYGFILPDEIIKFDASKVGEMIKAFDCADLMREENLLNITRDYRIAGSRDILCIRLKGKNGNVFVNEKYLKYFVNPTLYQEKANSVILVVEKYYSFQDKQTHEQAVGVVLPIRMDDIEKDYYSD